MNYLRLSDWESHLVVRAQQGDWQAFERLVDAHRSQLRSLASQRLRNPEDAYDAVQDTMVKAFRALGTFQAGRPVLPWLMRICNNCCIDIMRQRRASESLEKVEFALTSGEDLERSAVQGEDRNVLMKAIMRLPRHYREIVMMRHFRDMEVNEIAAELQKPEGTIKSWLFRARAMLRKDLTPAFEAL
ncbi:MAG: RNA polymerase sigma factor [Chthonomonas sp.]|nr:RNA polymerase sigma factor [Chthonomonas sp.]